MTIQYNPGMNMSINGDVDTYGSHEKRFTPWKFCPLMVFCSPILAKHVTALVNQEDGSLIYSKLRSLGVPINRTVYVAQYLKGRTKLSGVVYDVYDPISRLYLRVFDHTQIVYRTIKKSELSVLPFVIPESMRFGMAMPDDRDRFADT